jgi:hypothetical protein
MLGPKTKRKCATKKHKRRAWKFDAYEKHIHASDGEEKEGRDESKCADMMRQNCSTDTRTRNKYT